MIGRNPGAVAVDDAKTISVTISGEARGGSGFGDGLAQRGEIFFRDVRSGAIEQAIAIRAHRLDGDAVISEDAVEIAGAAAVQRVNNEFRLAFAENVEADQFSEPLQIVVAKIDGLGLGAFVVREFAKLAVFLGQFCGARFDVFGDFGQRRDPRRQLKI